MNPGRISATATPESTATGCRTMNRVPASAFSADCTIRRRPYTQAKLVRVILGAVLDVAVDIRKGSPTFGKHVAVELSGENKRQLFVPRGFAHGFVVLTDDVIFQYKCDNLYVPSHERESPSTIPPSVSTGKSRWSTSFFLPKTPSIRF